jgi:hypothetical protein
VTRAQWQANAPTAVTPLPASKVDTIYYHYTASEADVQENHANCASRVRGVQAFHQQGRGWNDIAYSFLVCKHGYVFEGRGYGVYTAATGADNSHSLAVCFLGDDKVNRDDLTPAGRKALVDITQAIIKWARHPLAYKGHRDAMNTRCPGDEIYRYITGPAFAHEVRVSSDDLRARSDFYSWAAWYLGEEDWKVYGKQNPSVRPNVPSNIALRRPTWFPRLAAMLAARKAAS